MKPKVTVIINEQHTLLEDQQRVLKEINPEFSLLKVPSAGWTFREQRNIAMSLIDSAEENGIGGGFIVVFASPIPALLMMLSRHEGLTREDGFSNLEVGVLHNDRRVAKELPDGKVIHTIAKDGWMIV